MTKCWFTHDRLWAHLKVDKADKAIDFASQMHKSINMVASASHSLAGWAALFAARVDSQATRPGFF